MPFFRKKPVEIEAVQLRWDTWNEMCDFAGVGTLTEGKPEGCYLTPDDARIPIENFPGGDAPIGMWIPTLEGLMIAKQDDWIVRGVQGELYPVKPDIFEATYEEVDVHASA